MNKAYYIVLFIFSFLSLQAQKQTTHWYFGANAGVDFSSGSPMSVTNGLLFTKEGTSSISDEFGNLRFYTDGVTVYTKNHTVMPNGEELYGSGSSTQAALIVPVPGISDLFYIFTTDAIEVSPKHGFRYSVVDMALGTEGEVISGQKNIPISLGGEQNVSEKIAATVKGDCSGYWIITYYKKKFYVFSLTEEGIDIANPVISESIPFTSNDDTVGGIKVSPDGKKLAACFADYTGSLILYNFNNIDGTISNGEALFDAEPMNDRFYYSVEFSPNSKVLYATYSGLVRYDLTAASIPDSEIVFYNTGNGTSGALQMGLDGKIYYARLNNQFYLAAINDPNNFNAPDLNLFSVFLGGKLHALGLPGFPQPFYNATLFINGKKEPQKVCQDVPVDFSYCFNGGVLPNWTVRWNFGDGNTSTEENPTHSYNTPGVYTVTLEITIGLNVIKATNTITILAKPKANQPANLTVCDTLPNDGFSEFLLSGQTASILGTQLPSDYTVVYYPSEDAAKTEQTPLPLSYTNTSSPQTIYARITSIANGCYDITSFTLTVNPVPEITNPDDLQVCEVTSGTGIAQFDLTESIPQITGGNTALSVKFYKTQANVINNIPITSPTNYTNSTPNAETVYFQATDPAAPDCKAGGSLDLIINGQPLLNTTIPAYKQCDYNNPGDGFEAFDLTSMYPSITSSPGLILSYEYQNAGTRVAITDPTNFTNTIIDQQTIYVWTINTSGCKREVSFVIEVNPLPVLELNTDPFYACEEVPGEGEFDVAVMDLEIINGAASYTVSYYGTDADARLGGTPDFTGTFLSPSRTIYARLVDIQTGCFTTTPVVLEVMPAPIAPVPAPLEICDANNDGYGIYNLDPVIQAIQTALGNVVVTVHETPEDADFNTNIITQTAAYNSNGLTTQTLYIRVQSDQTVCYDVVELKLIANPTPVIITPSPYALCDDGTSDVDGKAVFNLTIKASEVLGTLDPTLYSVTYYDNALAAETVGGIAIASPMSYLSASADVYVRVTNNATGCFKVVTLKLIVNPLPTAVQPIVPYILCDVTLPEGDGIEVFDLTTVIPAIITGQQGINVTFHHTYADAQGNIGAITTPEAYPSGPAVETLFVRVTTETTGCYRIVLQDLKVEPLPIILKPTQDKLTVCDTNGEGIGEFNLEALITAMKNGEPDLEITFHHSLSDAQTGSVPIFNTSDYINATPYLEFLYVRVVNPKTGCSNTYQLELRVEPAPQAPALGPLTLCDEDTNNQDLKTFFKLDDQDAVIYAALNATPGSLIIHYFISEAAARAGSPRITTPAHYYGTDGQEIWVRVESVANNCFSVTSFLLNVNKPLALTTPTMLTVCNEALPNDAQAVFDLTLKDNEILGPLGIGQGYTVAYYELNPRTNPLATPIATPKTYTNPAPPAGNPKTLYVVVTSEETCKSYTTLTIKVLPLPVPNFDPAPLELCDDNNSPDGIEEFNLELAEASIRNNDNQSIITYHTSLEDAEDGVNAIPVPTAYSSASAKVWVRMEADTNNPTDAKCYQVIELELIVNPLPAIGDPITGVVKPYAICEAITDGKAEFDLNSHIEEILGANAATDYDIEFYLDQAALDAGTALPRMYTNVTPNSQTILVVVTHIATGCKITKPLQLLVEESAIANPIVVTVTPLFECDDDGTNDGFHNFDLTQVEAEVLGTQNPTTYKVTYHLSEADADSDAAPQGLNPIATPTAFLGTNQTIWVRVTNTGTVSKCHAITSFDLKVELLPEPVLQGGTICVDKLTDDVLRSHVIDTGLDATHSFVWYKDNAIIVGETGPTLVITQPGHYTVLATSVNGCQSATMTAVEVIQSGPAVKVGVGYYVSDAFSDYQTITVEVEGYGVYQYKLDEGPWQDSPVFTDVSRGEHKVTVRDIKTDNPCDDLVIDGASVIDYPNFFTPNGDGFHDTWNIVGLQGTGAVIYIFDRYGKLMKQVSPDENGGWDGTFNGQPVPATDYWFTVTYPETVGETIINKEFKAHFSLKR